MKPSNIVGILAVSALALGSVARVSAQPVVTYSVSGTSGDYTLDFTVNNQTPGTQSQDIYFFGIYDLNGTVSGTPSGFTQYGGGFSPFNSDGAGSPVPLTYNLAWIDNTYGAVAPGTILSGFDVLDTSATAPTSIPYFAYGYDFGVGYTGPGNLDPRDNSFNPLFEGNTGSGAFAGTVPDASSTMALLGLCATGLLGLRRKQ
jgi:hypothetical protein